MKTQHTSGPWKLKTAGTFDRAGVLGQVALPSEKIKHWITIAECDYDAYIKGISAHQQDHHKRANDVAFLRSLQEANARLIASAPELLAVLKDVYSILLRDEDTAEYFPMEAIKKAIDKSTK